MRGRQKVMNNDRMKIGPFNKIPGHPPELSDSVKLLFIDACSHIIEIYLVLKSMH